MMTFFDWLCCIFGNHIYIYKRERNPGRLRLRCILCSRETVGISTGR